MHHGHLSIKKKGKKYNKEQQSRVLHLCAGVCEKRNKISYLPAATPAHISFPFMSLIPLHDFIIGTFTSSRLSAIGGGEKKKIYNYKIGL